MKEKLKVIFLQETILHYRTVTFNEIAKKVDFTVAYCKNDETKDDCLFSKFKFTQKKVGPFFLADASLRKKCKEYDVVIFMPDMHLLSFCSMPFLPHKYKVVCWGMGIRASYTTQYDLDRKHTLLDYIYSKIINASDATVVYMAQNLSFWKHNEINTNKVFVAINTVPVEPIKLNDERRDFLFVGTLYKKKGLDILIHSYFEASKRVASMPKLHIVGKGSEREIIEEQVRLLGLSDNVIFHGPIYDDAILCELFKRSTLCISPNQAGLSVAKSMGYGVTFVTKENAVTGGEIKHINNGETGILYHNDDDLIDIMIDAVNNPQKYNDIGKKAYDYYYSNATPVHMAKGVLDAVYYSVNH